MQRDASSGLSQTIPGSFFGAPMPVNGDLSVSSSRSFGKIVSATFCAVSCPDPADIDEVVTTVDAD